MKLALKLIVTLLSTGFCWSQQNPVVLDSLYKEDQFYIGVTYNLINKKPEGLSQNGFSTGFHFGFINDMPINSNRNVAIGIGLGYSVNMYNQNMQISKNAGGSFNYNLLNGDAFTKNRFAVHALEIPLEFRLRTSTPSEYKFWRIYTGFRFGYALMNRTKFDGDAGAYSYTNIKDFNKFNYGLTLSAGYNTWNVYVYYGLNSIFSDNVLLDSRTIEINDIKVGLMFYIL